MSAGPSNPTPAPGRQQRTRIKAAGVAVMEAYLERSQNYNPSREERKIILHEIQAIPGCESFDLPRVSNWFKRRRDIKERRNSQTQAQNNSPYPSLTKETIKYLTTLAQGQSSPSLNVIQTWAKLLHANVEDIEAWLIEQQQDAMARSRSPVYHLPTPVSTSPEPPSQQWDISSINAHKIDPLHSPVIPAPMPNITSTPTHTRPPTFSSSHLLEAITEASKTVQNPTKLPTTSEEFEKMFEPYLGRIETIIQRNQQYLQTPPPCLCVFILTDSQVLTLL
ncbi:hypothetical protein D9615_009141 [Tricholomella constricta]|uniref:Homeobox domain-containing protein n=1 Tax=Tricholomella constricta TaxID=117010 RepID=A0A8H5H2N7_9AGAR|nr:hypothetical protein D9615_009141 [Tricholomella constricta]